MPISIAISSGKGGVGKTSVAVNLALTLQKLGKRVAIFDADFGMANAHILLGVNPKNTLADVLSGDKTMEQILCKGPGNVTVLSGGTGLVEMLSVNPTERFQTIRMMDQLKEDIDILIVDVPAGANDNSISFIAASDHPILVLVGEPTSFLDAYSLIKASHLETGLSHFTVVVNMVASEAEGRRHFEKFNKIVTQFLDVKLRLGGQVPLSQRMRKSVVERKPVMLQQGDTAETRAFQNIAKQMLNAPHNESGGIRFFGNGKIAGD